ncbi:MAG TPA: glycosyltransferase family 4 protein [Candidatus Dormibacteraeota bacterium]|jgi:glycosyltransferase involved in cell wall biosynthesis|nr:glycosyltransferase family 4 protein [Candidatus Dormibacteraeota bacterium]
MRKLRVAWLGHKSAKGGDGIITYSREITSALRARGVEIVFFHHAQEPDLVPDRTSISLDAVQLSHRLVISPPRSRRKLIDLLQEHEIDVVHVSISFSSLDFNLPALCHRLGIPIVATFHVPFDVRFGVWGGLTSAVYRLYSQALSACDRVVIFGPTQRDILIKLGVPAGVVRVLPNGVDVDKYSPGPSQKRAEFGAARLFSYVGRIDPEKNVDVLLRAFLDADPPADLKMIVVGGGSERRRLERRYRDPRVIFTGMITDEADRIAILRASDAFFLPSSVEGLSLAMLEAMACGVATIATDVGSDGDSLRGAGIVIEPKELEAQLSLAIHQMIELPALAPWLGGLARERALERFSLAANVDGLLRMYGELLPEPV